MLAAISKKCFSLNIDSTFFIDKKATLLLEPQFTKLFPKIKLKFSSYYPNFFSSKLAKMGYLVVLNLANLNLYGIFNISNVNMKCIAL